MSRRMPMTPMACPAASRSADAFNVVGMTSPDAVPGWSRRFRVTPRSTTSRTAATNSWVSGGLRKRETDCSRTSSRRRPSNCETAAFASRILPRRSQTKTGSGAFATMTSAARVLRTLSSRVESRPRLPRTTVGQCIHSLFPLLALPLPTKARQRSNGCPRLVARALRLRWGPARPRKKVRDWPAHSGYLPAPTMDGRFILVEGARQNNLKTVGVRVPVGAVTAVTGVAGAGKSSLAFEVLHAEGYRRYVETFSPYARQFLERLDRPAADRIEGVLPSLAIDRTAPVRTSRSTVGTMTSIADYLRALWARAAVLHCKSCGQVVARDSPSSIFNALIAAAEGKQVLLCFPCRVGRVSAKALRETLQETGFRRVLENGSPVVLEEAELRAHDGVVTVVLDRIGVERDRRQRIIDSLESALRYGKGRVELHIDGHEEPLRFSEALHCARCDLGYSDPTPALFSFNNPVGACETCKGFGRTMEIDPDLVVPDPRLSIAQGCVKPFQTPFYGDCQQDLLRFLKRQRLRADAPWGDLPQETRRLIWEGEPGGRKQWRTRWYGIGGFFEWLESKAYRMHVRVLLSRYRRYSPCRDCLGARLKPAALLFRIDGKTLPDAESMSIADAERFFAAFKPNANDTASDLLLREIRGRLRFLCDVGLGYLTLSRQSRTLSGGEAQRVTLATALGSSLTSTLYVLDEPSVGLHPRDAGRLAGVLRRP